MFASAGFFVRGIWLPEFSETVPASPCNDHVSDSKTLAASAHPGIADDEFMRLLERYRALPNLETNENGCPGPNVGIEAHIADVLHPAPWLFKSPRDPLVLSKRVMRARINAVSAAHSYILSKGLQIPREYRCPTDEELDLLERDYPRIAWGSSYLRRRFIDGTRNWVVAARLVMLAVLERRERGPFKLPKNSWRDRFEDWKYDMREKRM